jgi:peptidyl-prolyl cis-trans isomerase-like protein 2
MGKNQHSKDGLHLRPTEWAQDGCGFKDRKRSPFAKLPLNCCFLSLQPFDKPVGTRDGSIFDVTNIVPYIKKYGKHPITGGRLEVSELFPLNFHKNGDDEIHCPVTFKVFTNNSHVVVNAASGNVYSFDAVDQLNRKQKNLMDLITNKPFKWTDIITIQDPDKQDGRLVERFFYIQEKQQDDVVKHITNKAALTPANIAEKQEKIRPNASIQRILDEKARIKEAKAKDEIAAIGDGTAKESTQPQAERKVNERFTSGEVAESFTSTANPLKSQNNLRLLTEEEELHDIYEAVRKKKTKGYVRIVTSVGPLNLELHTDMIPRTTDNFLRLCEKDYYDNTIFHRLIHNFMLQGGDPTGTGKGGASAFENGGNFKDEFDSRLTHQGGGVVSMANGGKNTNKSQFFVTLKSCQHLDNKHTIFGRIVGGLNLLQVFNDWQTDEKDRPVKEIKLIRTEVFKNPFKDAIAEASKPKKEEKVLDPVATWFSNRRDPMEEHKNRNSTAVGKYLVDPSVKQKQEPTLPAEETEYANVAQKHKRARTNFDFATW